MPDPLIQSLAHFGGREGTRQVEQWHEIKLKVGLKFDTALNATVCHKVLIKEIGQGLSKSSV